MTQATITSVAVTMKDLHPRPGSLIKQWVVDTRREEAWKRLTCPLVETPPHSDNTDAMCRNQGVGPWYFLDHDACSVCNECMKTFATREDIAAWIVELAARPPIETDRSKLSDEIEPGRAAIRR